MLRSAFDSRRPDCEIGVLSFGKEIEAAVHPRHCEPKAKQSRAASDDGGALDCFVAALLAMTVKLACSHITPAT